MKSYRPVSILPIVSEIMERAVQLQVLRYMNESNPLNKNLHGYRKLYSTTTVMLQMMDFTMEAADNKLIANAMMIDQSAAFDCMNALI